MKRLGKIAVCLAGGLLMNIGLRAATANRATTPAPAPAPVPVINPSPENPYAAIPTRNIFGLNPPAPLEPVVNPEDNLPKITPTGIMGVFGNLSVLFKVAPPGKPGPAVKDEYYTLSEGQRQDDIEVIKIDNKKSLVTFDNHGITQELPLAEPSASGGATPASPGGMNPAMAPGARGGVGNNGPGGFTTFGAGPAGNRGVMPNTNPGVNGGDPSGANGGMSFGANTQGHVYQPEAPTMSAEDAQAMLVINHLKAQVAGDPTANLFPPTPHDQEAGVNSNSQ